MGKSVFTLHIYVCLFTVKGSLVGTYCCKQNSESTNIQQEYEI